MKRRLRVVAALLALFAFSASFAEGLWASTCAPMAAMGSSPGGSEPGAMMAMDAPAPLDRTADGPMDMDSPADDSTSGEPGCPLTPVLGGCATVFSPAAGAAAAFVPTIAAQAAAAPDPAPDLLLVFSLHRPPRA